MEAIIFVHKGLTVTIRDEGKDYGKDHVTIWREKDCVVEWRSDFNKWEEKCVKMTGKKMVIMAGEHLEVDWEVYRRFKHQQKHSNRILQDIGILSFDPVKNWEIVGGGCLSLNPQSPAGNIFYFTREEDIKKYAQLEYEWAMYNWRMQQIARVIPGIPER